LFGLFHLEPTQIVGTTVLGIGFGLVRILTGSVALCMLTHGAYNAAVILALTQVPDAPTHEIEPASVALGLAAAIGGAMLLAKTSGRARSVPDRLD
jgi:membrane protease YdiL (CAAX protease family)